MMKSDWVNLLEPLFVTYDVPMVPASPAALQKLRVMASERHVPGNVVEQLADFYAVVNGVPSLDSLSIFECADVIIFEWWESRELWLGQRDFYTLRWHNEKYCVGDATTISFSPAHEFSTFIEGISHMVSLYE